MKMQREDHNLALFNQRRLADLTFVVGGEEIRVHRAILGAASPYFFTMLFGATNEAEANIIPLNETPLKQFKEVIRFCYLKKVTIGGWTTDEVCNLLGLAHEYNFDSLMEEIAKEIQKQHMLNPISLPIYHNLAVGLNLRPFLKAIKFNVGGSIVDSEEFVEYSANLVCFIFNTLQVTPSAIDALWKWKATHTDQEVEQVFKSIPWARLRPEIFAEVMRVMIPKTDLSSLEKPDFHSLPEASRMVQGMDP